MTNKVSTSGDVGEIECKSFIGFLVDDDKGKLVTIAPGVDTPSVGVGISKVDLGCVTSEVCTIPIRKRSVNENDT